MPLSSGSLVLVKACVQLSIMAGVLLFSLVVIILQRDKANSDCESEYHVYALVVILFVSNILSFALFPLVVYSYPLNMSFKTFFSHLHPSSTSSSPTLRRQCWCWVFCCLWYFALLPAFAFWAIAVLAKLGDDKVCRVFFQAGQACSSVTVGFARALCQLSRLHGQLIFQVILALIPLALAIVGVIFSLRRPTLKGRGGDSSSASVPLTAQRTAINEETSLLSNAV
ncbi:hypothetical protein QOT17_021445 [Balamuthia mandrillaris]